MKYDLCEPGQYTMQSFCIKVAELAISDFKSKNKGYKSGFEICNLYCNEWRKFHEILAARIYNGVKRSFQVAEKERTENVR